MKPAVTTMLLNRGAPQEEVLACTIEIAFKGPLLASLEGECERRRCGPARLLAEIIEAVFEDGLVGALLDD